MQKPEHASPAGDLWLDLDATPYRSPLAHYIGYKVALAWDISLTLSIDPGLCQG